MKWLAASSGRERIVPEEELARAREKTDTDEHQLAPKCFQKLGRFPEAREVPVAVVDHVRRCLWPDDADESVTPACATAGTAAPAG